METTEKPKFEHENLKLRMVKFTSGDVVWFSCTMIPVKQLWQTMRHEAKAQATKPTSGARALFATGKVCYYQDCPDECAWWVDMEKEPTKKSKKKAKMHALRDRLNRDNGMRCTCHCTCPKSAIGYVKMPLCHKINEYVKGMTKEEKKMEAKFLKKIGADTDECITEFSNEMAIEAEEMVEEQAEMQANYLKTIEAETDESVSEPPAKKAKGEENTGRGCSSDGNEGK